MFKHILAISTVLLMSNAVVLAEEEKLISRDLLSGAFKKNPMICFQNASNKWNLVSKVDSEFPQQYATSTSCQPFTNYMQGNYTGWDNKRYYPTGGGFFYCPSSNDYGHMVF